MKLAALGLLGAVVVGSLAMGGCSPKANSPAPKTAATGALPYWEEMPGTTTLTNATLTNTTVTAKESGGKKLLIPYVNFDDPNEAEESEALDPENIVVQTWGAPYQAFEGYDSKLGF